MASTRGRGFPSAPDLALLEREMERCGWRPEPAGATGGLLEGPLSIRGARGVIATPMKFFASARDARLALIDLRQATLPTQTEMFTRFLDFPMEVRLALTAARRFPSVQFALIVRRDLIQFFRMPGEFLERQVEDERGIEDELLPGLAARARSRVDRISGSGDQLERSEALRGWIKDWGRRLGSHLRIAGETCEQFVWELALMLQVDRKIHRSEAVSDWGLSAERVGDGWILGYDAMGAHADLDRVIDRFYQTFSSRVFSGDADERRQWLYELDETPLIERLRAELLMQTQARFEPDSVAWIFARMDRETEGWRREMAGHPPVHKQFAARGWSVIEPLTIDVGRFGLTAALRDFERLADYWDEYAEFRRDETERGVANVDQPDLFAGAPRGVNAEGLLTDPLNFIFSESLRLRGVEPQEEFGVGLAFLLKAVDLAANRGWPFAGVDSLDRVWTP